MYRALEAGAMAYVLKDAAGAELLSAVRAVCSGRRYVSPALGDLPAPGVRRAPLDALSARERQVLQLVVEGRTSAEIARTVHLSPKIGADLPQPAHEEAPDAGSPRPGQVRHRARPYAARLRAGLYTSPYTLKPKLSV